LGSAVEAVLPDCVLDVLAGQWVLELRGEDGQAVQEEDQVEAVFILLAIVHLAADREEIAGPWSLRYASFSPLAGRK